MDAARLRDEALREERLDEESFHLFALDAMVGALREEEAYAQNGRTGLTLLKNGALRVVLEVARAGNRIGEHVVSGPTFVQVLEGSVHAVCGDETRVARAGEMIVVPHEQRREMRAEGDSAFLWAFSLD